MPDADIPVVFVENRFTARLTRCIRLAPEHFKFLPGITLDHRHPDPDTGLSNRRVPFIDLVS
jgi:hypothetical protein